MILTANQKRAIRRLWKCDLTRLEIAEEIGFTPEQLDEAAAALSLPERDDPVVYLPSREEIRLATARLRSQWSQAEREARISAAWSGKIKVSTEDEQNACRGTPTCRTEGGEADRQARREPRRG